MKAIAVSVVAGRFSTRLYADSAIFRDVMPFFIPDVPAAWTSQVCLALRIGRLGKSVSEAFAMRYVDAYSALSVQSTDAAIDTSIMDQAVMVGRWLDVSAMTTGRVALSVDGAEAVHDVDSLEIPAVIAHVTRYATIKTGDIIILMNTATEVPLKPPGLLIAAVDGHECLRMKIR